ncbi:MAG TPA: diguanylate cyclase [Spirochaetota bacterium]|nr:diguanylate cyclase [Spirochaetota bacterium]
MYKKSKILIVDDMANNIQLAANILKLPDLDISYTRNGKSTLEIVEKEDFDLILLDIMMPDMNGYEVCEKLKSNEKTKEIPVIFLTAKSDIDSVVTGFDYGAVDYITKPFNAKELVARVTTHLHLKKARESLEIKNRELEQKNEELEKIMKKLDDMSKTDMLTGLPNRRYIIERLDNEIHRVKRTKKYFSLMIADIDHFKNFNDNFGHDCGDFVLKEIARLLKESLREIDTVARWGGEEFLILLPETTVECAFSVAERMRIFIFDQNIVYKGASHKVPITIGISEFDETKNIDVTLKEADIALYHGKNNGRNQSNVYKI